MWRHFGKIKIIYFVPLCLIVLIVSDYMVHTDPQKLDIKNLESEETMQSDTIKKLQHGLIFLSEARDLLQN